MTLPPTAVPPRTPVPPRSAASVQPMRVPPLSAPLMSAPPVSTRPIAAMAQTVQGGGTPGFAQQASLPRVSGPPVSTAPYAGAVAQQLPSPAMQPVSFPPMVGRGVAPAAISRAPSSSTPYALPVRTVLQSPSPLAGLSSQVPTLSTAASLVPAARDTMDSSVFGNRSGRLRSRFQATLFWSCLLVGIAVTSYRTDVLLLGARNIGQESAYLELEKRWLGGAPAGTPRELAPLVGHGAPTELLASQHSTALAVPSAEPETAPSAATVGALDDPRGQQGAETQPAEPTAKDAAERGETPPQGATTAALPARPKTPSRTGSSGGAGRDLAVSAPRPVARPKPVAAKPKPSQADQVEKAMPAPGSDDFLRMNMREAVRKSEVNQKARKKKTSSAFDPLNGEL